LSGTWTYSYAQGTSQNQTVVQSPCGTTTETFLGVGNQTQVPTWQIGLTQSRSVDNLETLQYTWRTPLSGDQISNDTETVGFNTTTGIFVPLPQLLTITRGGRNYLTQYDYHTTNFNDFGRAYLITENGDLPTSRQTTRGFDYGFPPSSNIVDKVQ